MLVALEGALGSRICSPNTLFFQIRLGIGMERIWGIFVFTEKLAICRCRSSELLQDGNVQRVGLLRLLLQDVRAWQVGVPGFFELPCGTSIISTMRFAMPKSAKLMGPASGERRREAGARQNGGGVELRLQFHRGARALRERQESAAPMDHDPDLLALVEEPFLCVGCGGFPVDGSSPGSCGKVIN